MDTIETAGETDVVEDGMDVVAQHKLLKMMSAIDFRVAWLRSKRRRRKLAAREVAKDLDQATRVGLNGPKRRRVVTLDGKLVDTCLLLRERE